MKQCGAVVIRFSDELIKWSEILKERRVLHKTEPADKCMNAWSLDKLATARVLMDRPVILRKLYRCDQF